MKSLLLLPLLSALPVWGQVYVGYAGRCQLGNVHAVTQGLASTNTFVGTFPGCTVTVYGAGSTTPAVLYRDKLGTPLPNPFTASTESSFLFFADKGAYPLDVTIAGAGIATPYTFAGVTPFALDGVVTDPMGSQIIAEPPGSVFQVIGDVAVGFPTQAHTLTVYGNGVVTGVLSANGGNFSGPVVLPPGVPTGQQAVSATFLQQQLAQQNAAAAGAYLALVGGTLSGPLNLASDTPTGRQAADANFVESFVAAAIKNLVSDTANITNLTAKYIAGSLTGAINVSKLYDAPALNVVSDEGCQLTYGAVGNTCTTTITLNATEPNTQYIPVCLLEDTNGPTVLGAVIASTKTTTSFQVPSYALTSGPAGHGQVGCIIATDQ